MATRGDVKNYLVSVKDTKTDEVIWETFVQGYMRYKGDFMLKDLYEKFSPGYQQEPYSHTIELQQTQRMQIDLERLITRFGNKVSATELHLHVGKDKSLYLCYPPQMKSWEEAEEIMRKFFAVTYFQIKTRIDSNYLEMFGSFLLKAEGVEPKKSVSVFEEYVKWICRCFNLEVTVVELNDSQTVDYLTKEELFSSSVSSVGFSKRVETCLKSADILTIAELVQWDTNDLRKIRDFGEKSWLEVRAFLIKHYIITE